MERSGGCVYALVTGASSGMGREFARQLACRGYGVVLVGEREAELHEAAAEIAAAGREAVALCVDLTQADAVDRIVARTDAEGLDIGVMVSNAGALLFGGFAVTDPEAMARLVALHCTAPTLLCRRYAERMRRRGGGHILIVSSATAWMPLPAIALYAATKGYLLALADALHDELARDGVSVTGLYPGAVDTPLYRLDECWRRRCRRWGVMNTPEAVVRRALGAMFRERRRCVPGFFTRICVTVCRLLPAGFARPLLRLEAVKRLLE